MRAHPTFIWKATKLGNADVTVHIEKAGKRLSVFVFDTRGGEETYIPCKHFRSKRSAEKYISEISDLNTLVVIKSKCLFKDYVFTVETSSNDWLAQASRRESLVIKALFPTMALAKDFCESAVPLLDKFSSQVVF